MIGTRLVSLQRVVICALLALGFCAPSTALAASSPPVSVPSGLLMTLDGHLLWSTHPTQSRHVASTIKMLNALVVREHANLDDQVVVTKQSEIANGGVRLVAGQRLTVRQLLEIMLIHSANDAAMALAIHVGGSEARFVAMMNAKAESLGLTHTHAVDPNGLSGREVSTADDLAVLGRHVMADPVLRAMVGRATVQVPRPNGTSATYPSSDLMMGHYAGLEGVKTGFTSGAGFCYVGAARRSGVELLGVVLGTPSEAARFADMRKLFDWGFAHTKVEQVVSAGESHVAEVAGRRVTLRASQSATAVVIVPGGALAKRVVGAQGGGASAALVVAQGGYPIARVPLGAAPPRAAGGRNAPVLLIVLVVVAGVAIATWFFLARRRANSRVHRGSAAQPAGPTGRSAGTHPPAKGRRAD